MTNEIKESLIGLGKKYVSDLTTELNNEVKKFQINLTQEEKENIIVNCDGIVAKLNRRLSQMGSSL